MRERLPSAVSFAATFGQQRLTEEDCTATPCLRQALSADTGQSAWDMTINASNPCDLLLDAIKSSQTGLFAVSPVVGVGAQCACCGAMQHEVVSVPVLPIDPNCGFVGVAVETYKSRRYEGACASREYPEGVTTLHKQSRFFTLPLALLV